MITSPLICSADQWNGLYDWELQHERVKSFDLSLTLDSVTIFTQPSTRCLRKVFDVNVSLDIKYQEHFELRIYLHDENNVYLFRY